MKRAQVLTNSTEHRFPTTAPSALLIAAPQTQHVSLPPGLKTSRQIY